MIVTKIKKSKKGNILIYADNEYYSSVPLEVFIKSRLKIGDAIDEDILEELQKETELNKAKEKALRLLSLRAHSKKELRDKINNSSNEDVAREIADKMEDLGLVNDRNFADAYAKELFTKKMYSSSRIRYELSKKGISDDIIDDVMESVEFNDRDNIEKIFGKKRFDKGDEKQYRRVVAYCQRMGYSWNDIKSVINSYN